MNKVTITDEDDRYLSNLSSIIDSIESKIKYARECWGKLQRLYAMRENGIDDLKIDITGKYGRSSCDKRPELCARYGESTNIPQKVLDELIHHYELNIKREMDILESVTIIRPDKL